LTANSIKRKVFLLHSSMFTANFCALFFPLSSRDPVASSPRSVAVAFYPTG